MRFLSPFALLLLSRLPSLSQCHIALGRRTTTDSDRHLHAARSITTVSDGKVKGYKDFELKFREVHTSPGDLEATVKFSSGDYTILLEELDPLLRNVQCRPGAIEIEFVSRRARNIFEVSIETFKNDELRFVTAHATCNEAGGRAPFKGLTITYDNNIAVLIVQPISWSDYTYSLALTRSQDKTIVPISQTRLQRRQSEGEPSTTSDPEPTSTESPEEIGESNAEPTLRDFSLNKTAIDEQLIPFSNSTAEEYMSPVPEGFTLTCKNCTVLGNFELISGLFDFTKSTEDFLGGFKNSFLEIVANDFFAQVELEINWEGAALVSAEPAFDFRIPFIQIPLAGIIIPGIAKIGPVFESLVVFEMAVEKDLQFSYGFQVAIPDNSTAIANFGNVNESTITGFGDTELTALPFNATVDNPTLNLAVALKPRIGIDVQILSGLDAFRGGAAAGIFLNIPKFKVEIASIKGPVDENCTELLDRPPTDVENILDSFGNLTHIVTSYDISAGFEVEFDQLGPKGPEPVATWVPLSKNFTAPTACIQYVSGTGFVAATAIASSIASSISSELAMEATELLDLAGETLVGDYFGAKPAPTGESAAGTNSASRPNMLTQRDLITLQGALMALLVIAGGALML